jgi:hypothetical protein
MVKSARWNVTCYKSCAILKPTRRHLMSDVNVTLIFVHGFFTGDCHCRMEFSEILLIREDDNPIMVIYIYIYKEEYRFYIVIIIVHLLVIIKIQYIYIYILLRTVTIQTLQPSIKDYQPFPAGAQL